MSVVLLEREHEKGHVVRGGLSEAAFVGVGKIER